MLKLPLKIEESEHSPKIAVYDFTDRFIFETHDRETALELCERVNAERWISIGEKLPAKNGYYLVFGSNEDLEEDIFECYYEKGANDNFHWQWNGEFAIVPTHWRELPPNPSDIMEDTV